jgi:hypothetical protein
VRARVAQVNSVPGLDSRDDLEVVEGRRRTPSLAAGVYSEHTNYGSAGNRLADFSSAFRFGRFRRRRRELSDRVAGVLRVPLILARVIVLRRRACRAPCLNWDERRKKQDCSQACARCGGLPHGTSPWGSVDFVRIFLTRSSVLSLPERYDPHSTRAMAKRMLTKWRNPTRTSALVQL